jgi:hypothetical protein
LALAGVVWLGAAVTAAITISPTSHDFGSVARRGIASVHFTLTVSPVTPGATLRLTITGPDAADFSVNGAPNEPDTVDLNNPARCAVSSQGAQCEVYVEFRPQSNSVLGPKAARLEAIDSRGNVATAPLKGKVVAALCEHKVVPCNYAMFYSGTVAWTSGLSGPGGTESEHVQVDVVNGVASCNGSATSASLGRTRTGSITGTGLIAVEFEETDTSTTGRPSPKILVYRVTVACPSPAWPATVDEAATPSRPAELGHNEQGSYNQPATGGIGMNLEGSSSIPSPDADPANGITGLVSVRWSLKRS